MFQFHPFTYSCPVFPAPLIEETAFPALYSLASFVVHELTMSAWVLFLDSPLPLIFVFVPVSYCLDHCSFCSKSSLKSGHIIPLVLFYLKISLVIRVFCVSILNLKLFVLVL